MKNYPDKLRNYPDKLKNCPDKLKHCPDKLKKLPDKLKIIRRKNSVYLDNLEFIWIDFQLSLHFRVKSDYP